MDYQDDQQNSIETARIEDINNLVGSKMNNKSIINILTMSVSFFLIFTAFNTASLIQKVVVNSINKQTDVNWNAFLSLCLIYFVMSLSNFLAPSILSVLSSTKCLFFSSLAYLTYVAVFLYPVKYELEIASVILGFGAALIWTSQGNYLSANSDYNTIDRNTGIFWAIFQGSLVFGNLFTYYQFQGVEEIDEDLRFKTYSVLTAVCLAGCLMLIFLKKTVKITTDSDITGSNPWIAFKKCLSLFKTKKMILLSLTCFYTGLELSFYTGVYPTVIGYTKKFGKDSKKLIGLYGLCVGIGSILGGLLFSISGKRFSKNNRSKVVITGFLFNLASFILIFLNHSQNSTVKETDESGIFEPKAYVSIICGLFFGFGDACFNTQIYSLIGSIYTTDSNYTSSAFALFKFTQSIGAAISFFYSSLNIVLYIHLIILVFFSILALLSFVLVEIQIKKEAE